MISSSFGCFGRSRASVFVCLLAILIAGLNATKFSALTRKKKNPLRIASYNVYYSSCIPTDKGHRSGTKANNRIHNFARIVKAMDSDILALQEVFHAPKYFLTKTPAGILRYMESIYGEKLYMAHDYAWTPERPRTGKTGRGGRFIFSRFPIIAKGHFARRVTWALVKPPAKVSDTNILVINVHLSHNKQAKETGAFIADVVAGKMEPKIPSDVMIMVTGDFNNEPGKSRYNNIYNSVDGFIDLEPTHLGWKEPINTTVGGTEFDEKWRPVNIYNRLSETGQPLQKRIDFMFWLSDDLESRHAHILNPLIMNNSTLETYGLHQIDTALRPRGGLRNFTSSDHFPYFADFYDPKKKRKVDTPSNANNNKNGKQNVNKNKKVTPRATEPVRSLTSTGETD